MSMIKADDEWRVDAQLTGECSIPECPCHQMAHSDDSERQDQPPPPLWADAATVRAAIADTLDDGWQCGKGCDLHHPWTFPTEMFPGDEEPNVDDVKLRSKFIDTVIARITQLQHPPHNYPRRPQEAA